MLNLLRKAPDDLLKKATAKKKAGDLENAIKLLKQAYEQISKESISYPVDTFLRLPLYLQEAKRNDEAWREFNVLLTEGYPNQTKDPELIPMDHASIYDKMRLFLQREGKNVLAVRFGIFSWLSSLVGLYRQKRIDQLTAYSSLKDYKDTIRIMLRKAQKEELLEQLIGIMEEHINNLPNVDFTSLSTEIDSLGLK